MNDAMIMRLVKDEGEKGLLKVVLRQNEELMEIKKSLKEFAQAFDALTRVQTMLNGVADGMAEKIGRLEKRDDDPRSTREIIG